MKMPPRGPDVENKIILFYSILFYSILYWILFKQYISNNSYVGFIEYEWRGSNDKIEFLSLLRNL
jgi:hypothetical protein